MSNSEPSAIVRQGIPCMGGLYNFRFEWRNGSLKVRRTSKQSGSTQLHPNPLLAIPWLATALIEGNLHRHNR